ncbi:MAG TPA: hypothetical protein VGQ59_06300 [Cyclobacteriaceae bacterium]|jgi:hypothetical protein|nr:hypothetical protein [Cyclobacteriaceae bacterium]
MKTKMLIIAVFCCIASAANSAPSEKSPTVDIIRKDTTSVYLVNYLGSKTGKVTITVKDNAQAIILVRSFRDIKDFSLPLNFSSVAEGVYTVQIDNGVEKVDKTLNYTKDIAINYTRVENLGNGQYLLTSSHTGKEKITVRIYNESNVKVYEEDKIVRGNFSLLFNLKNVTGQPYFEVTEKSDTFILVPGHPQIIQVKE